MSRAFADVDWWEHRADRPYDEQSGAKVLCPRGVVAVSFDRPTVGALLRAALDERRATTDEERKAS